ncbi:hypothetical protein [Arcobacter sp. FWKO B]|uniref:hypothetical protein n=1 Tax=Arcobacter sp. FWKO B TaxID=2593672 RepID=UPI0018A58732|nr:hypothetical protein [Arcobacter sp. FWKO B]QOG11240.1 hypothetical protein FWKOB_00400 [Arcobacter sp. FWKO B]
MNHKHFRQIILANNIQPQTFGQTKLCLKLVTQKEKFILEDAVKALLHNKQINPLNGFYSTNQYINQVLQITHRYYALYIQISQFEAFLRTFINHKMIKGYGNQWHKDAIISDISDFSKYEIQKLDKPSKALNAISFGTLELIFFNGSRYGNIFEKYIKKHKILTKDHKIKYNNKKEIKSLFSIIRNARNDICHHRRIGESIRTNPKYSKHKMTLSKVTNALEDLKILLGYDNRFDVKSLKIEYKDFK